MVGYFEHCEISIVCTLKGFQCSDLEIVSYYVTYLNNNLVQAYVGYNTVRLSKWTLKR